MGSSRPEAVHDPSVPAPKLALGGFAGFPAALQSEFVLPPATGFEYFPKISAVVFDSGKTSLHLLYRCCSSNVAASEERSVFEGFHQQRPKLKRKGEMHAEKLTDQSTVIKNSLRKESDLLRI